MNIVEVNMIGTVDINDGGITVNIAGGGKIVMGDCGDNTAPTANPLPPLTPDEKLYGRGLCLLPAGWEELNGDEHWQLNLSESLRQLWPLFNKEQKMAISYSIGELAAELRDSAFSHR